MSPSKKNRLFEKYMTGDISRDEMHELNQYALEDDFLFEALEGAAGFEDGNNKAITDLNQRLARKSKKKSPLFIWISSAAAIALLIIAFTFIPEIENDTLSDGVVESKSEIEAIEDDEIAIVLDAEEELEAEEESLLQPVTPSPQKSTAPKPDLNISSAPTRKKQNPDEFQVKESIEESKVEPIQTIDIAESKLKSTKKDDIIIDIKNNNIDEADKSIALENRSASKPARINLKQKKLNREDTFLDQSQSGISPQTAFAEKLESSPIYIQFDNPDVALRFQDFVIGKINLEDYDQLILIDFVVNEHQEASEIDFKTEVNPSQSEEIIDLVESFKEWGDAGNKTLRILFNK